MPSSLMRIGAHAPHGSYGLQRLKKFPSSFPYPLGWHADHCRYVWLFVGCSNHPFIQVDRPENAVQ